MVRTIVAGLSTLALLSCAGTSSVSSSGKEQQLVDRAVDAMGGAQALGAISNLTVKGSFKQWEPEQSDVPGGPMRFANETTFEVAQDRAAGASRTDFVKNFAYPAPRTFRYSEIVTADAGAVIGVDNNGMPASTVKSDPPVHAMSGVRLAATLREALRGSSTALLLAMKNNPDKLRATPNLDAGGALLPAAAYDAPNGVLYIVGFDPATGLPARVRTLDYDFVWGDVNYDVVFGDWRDVGGVKIPFSRRYELSSGAMGAIRGVTETQFSEVNVNPAIDRSRLAIPGAVASSAARPASGNVPYQWAIRRQFIGTYMDSDDVRFDKSATQSLRLQELAPGVMHVQGGTHNNLLVEMSNYLVVFDAPVSDAQSLWVIDAARQRFPGKPIRYVVMTHHHNDHSGGLRAFVAEGATVVVGQGAAQHYRSVLSAPWTRNPDLKARSLADAQIVEVADKYVLADGKREVIAYLIDNPHAKGMLMGYIPDAKLGFVTDIWSPGPPLPPKPNPGLVSVVNAVKKAGIQPERFAGGHGSNAPYSQLTQLVGQ
jgi:glyoxylase-like metal-dependent hydrolase (beta-lactamase superfamily II)